MTTTPEMKQCPKCHGAGEVSGISHGSYYTHGVPDPVRCPVCRGQGEVKA